MPGSKVCPRKDHLVPVENFSKNKRTVDGLEVWCKDCRREYRNTPEQKEKERQLQQKRYWSNPEGERARTARWRENNLERNAARQKRYRDENREACRERSRKHSVAYKPRRKEVDEARYVKNREEIIERVKAWNRANPDRVRASSMRRRARAKSFGGAPDIKSLQMKLEYWGGVCYLCGHSLLDNFHWDHVKPISKGGASWVSNLRPTHPECNQKKHAEWPIRWKRKGGDEGALISARKR